VVLDRAQSGLRRGGRDEWLQAVGQGAFGQGQFSPAYLSLPLLSQTRSGVFFFLQSSVVLLEQLQDLAKSNSQILLFIYFIK